MTTQVILGIDPGYGFSVVEVTGFGVSVMEKDKTINAQLLEVVGYLRSL